MPAPDRLFAVASKCLAIIEAHYATANVELPDRRGVTHGNAIYDCEQLTVQVERTYSIQGAAAAEVVADTNCLGMRAATLAITTLRCVPTQDRGGKPPRPAAEEAAAQVVLQDPTLQWTALREAFKAGGLKPYDHGLAFETWQAIGPDGGLSGGTMRVRWALAAGPALPP
jgi:hypothetical protein